MIVAGDIGGTKCNLALFDLEDSGLIPLFEATYKSNDYSGLEEAVSVFLNEEFVAKHRKDISGYSFGIAGPVVNGKVKTPNLPWSISQNSLKEYLGLESVALLNDLEATGYGVLILPDSELKELNQGIPDPQGNFALIAAGTGLGEALIVQTQQGPIPIPSEGGHTDFAPRTSVEIGLLIELSKRYNTVSYERVLSGPGLFNIYKFLRDSSDQEDSLWYTTELKKTGDPSAAIAVAAINGRCPICTTALDLFVSIYGAEAGNLALTLKATGGVFICGGIAPKILPKLTDGSFMKAFRAKGRLEKLLSKTPVKIVLNQKTALLGAADFARRF
jgi:glucokinase